MSVATRCLAALFLAVPIGATMPPVPAGNAKVLDDLMACRAITTDAERLACFDKGIARFADAADHGDVRVIDRAQVNRTKRALFGFALPSLDIFAGSQADAGKHGHDRKDEEELKEITAKIAAVGKNRDGGYILTLDDGSRWEQTDSVISGRNPKPGNTVTIRRGVLGSYKMKVEPGPAMKARRIE